MPNKPPLTREFLKKVYLHEKLSTWAIEKRYGYSRSSVFNALKKFDIQTRSIAQSHVKYERNNFSGNLEEKSYMLGFVIGDMRTRDHNKDRSETISIASGSTKLAQIDLIKGLFKPYGRVWIGRPNERGVVNVEAFVNKSFSFLLPKTRDYTWCADKKSHFYSFLAGFTDAEGSFFISGGKAFVSWGNYDEKLLQFIHTNLTNYGVEVPQIHSDKLKGYRGSHGYRRNADYYHLSICRKLELNKFVKEIKQYLRHKDKLKKLAEVEKNLKLRSNK